MGKSNFIILVFLLTCISFINTVNGQDLREEVHNWAKTNFNFQCEDPTNISVEKTNDTYFINYDGKDKENSKITYSNSLRVSKDGAGRIRVEKGSCFRYKYYDRKIVEDEKYLTFNSNGYISEVGFYNLVSGGSTEGSWDDFVDRTYDQSNVVIIKKYSGSDYNEYQMYGCRDGEEPIKVTEHYNDKSLKSVYDKSNGIYKFYLQGISTPDYTLELRNGKFQGSFISHYDNGQVKIKSNYEEGEYNGSYEEFTKDGDTLLCGNYKMGTKSSEWKELISLKDLPRMMDIGTLYKIIGDTTLMEAESTQIYRKAYYNESGSIEGKAEITSKSNELIAVFNIKDNEVHGELRLYYDNGNTFGEINYESGEMVGYPRFFDLGGKDISFKVITKYNDSLRN